MGDAIASASRVRARPIPDAIIARLSPLAVALRFIGAVAILFICWYWALNPASLGATNGLESGALVVAALAFTPALSWTEWVTLRQMIFHQSRAVWIEDGCLKFIDDTSLRRHFRSLAVADIRELSLVPYYIGRNPWGFPRVSILMKDGQDGGSILTLYFTDSAQIVRARLIEALGLGTARSD
ncbi:MAG TPA: hypothetical protein VN685_00370 [Rhizomicrobium sp.]|nr:hypothetical protein [Rhizomicrobium sp.]